MASHTRTCHAFSVKKTNYAESINVVDPFALGDDFCEVGLWVWEIIKRVSKSLRLIGDD